MNEAQEKPLEAKPPSKRLGLWDIMVIYFVALLLAGFMCQGHDPNNGFLFWTILASVSAFLMLSHTLALRITSLTILLASLCGLWQSKQYAEKRVADYKKRFLEETLKHIAK